MKGYVLFIYCCYSHNRIAIANIDRLWVFSYLFILANLTTIVLVLFGRKIVLLAHI